MDASTDHPRTSSLRDTTAHMMDDAQYILKNIEDSHTAQTERLQLSTSALPAGPKQIEEAIKKIRFCLSTFIRLQNEVAKQAKSFSYEQANAIICFIETFALVGVGDKDKKNDLVKHFETFFPASDQKAISDTRKLLLKNPNQLIDINDLLRFVKDEDVYSFFTKLTQYVQGIVDKLESKEGNDSVLTSFLVMFNPKKDRGKVGTPVTCTKAYCRSALENLSLLSYTVNTKNVEKIQEILFQFIVNIFPSLETVVSKRKSKECFNKLRHIRNRLIHMPHLWGLPEFRQHLSTSRSLLFKYMYTEEVHSALVTAKHETNPAQVEKQSRSVLKKFQKKFSDIERDAQYKTYLVGVDEARKSFEYKFVKSLFPHKDDDINDLVDQYLKFMLITEEAQIDREDGNKKRINIEDAERRRIFETFLKIKNKSSIEVEELKSRLSSTHSVQKINFDVVVRNFIKQHNPLCLKETEVSIVKNIKNVLLMLKNMQKDYSFSSVELIGIFEYEGTFDFDKINRPDLTSARTSIVEKFNNLSNFKGQVATISVDGLEMKIELTKVVGNMLKIFYNAYNEYRINFDNIEEALGDKQIIQFFNDISQAEGTIVKKESSNGLIKTLLGIPYTAPFIVAIVTQGDCVNMEDADLDELINILLSKEIYLKHLALFLSHMVRPDLYKTLAKLIIEKKLAINSLKTLLVDPTNTNGFLLALCSLLCGTSAEISGVSVILRETIDLSNNIAIEWSYSDNYEKAFSVLQSLKEIIDLLVEKACLDRNNQSILFTRVVNAKMYINQGAKAQDQSQKKIFFERSRDICAAIKQSEGIARYTAPYFLAIDCLAYSFYELEEYSKAYEEYQEEQRILVNFALCLPENNEITLTHEVYTLLCRSERYQSILASSVYAKKYLNILYMEIGRIMAYSMSIPTTQLEIQEAKNIYGWYENLYDINKKIFGVKSKESVNVLRKLAGTANTISYLVRSDSRENVHWLIDSIVKWCTVLVIQEEKYGSLHEAVIKVKKRILQCSKMLEQQATKAFQAKRLSEEHKRDTVRRFHDETMVQIQHSFNYQISAEGVQSAIINADIIDS